MENLPLFNINGYIGRGAYEVSDFPTIESFVEHLDYTGVERSLVWHVFARDINPYYGNRILLEEIEKAKLGERLLPSFVITPPCFFEYETRKFLREQLGSGGVRTLTIIPDVSRFYIRQIERVLSDLAEYDPVILWDCRHNHDELAVRDFEYIASRFPDISFVVTQKMWGCFGSVLDLMWRCPNTYIDTSWVHMNESIELLTENFGAERILFGLGSKAHYGAAVAALAHAEINDRQREQIAHSNIERLLKTSRDTKISLQEPEIMKSKSLWKTFRSGAALKVSGIIDSHGHTPPFTRGWVFRQNDIRLGIEETIAKMDRLGIEKLVLTYEPAIFGPNLPLNKEGEEIMKPFRDRLYGYLAFNPLFADEMAQNFDSFFKGGFFLGFKLYPGYLKIPLTDPAFVPVWEYADRYRRPILMHAWDDNYGNPSKLKDIAGKYPGAIYVLGHSGGGTNGRLEAEELALSHKNVYLEFCGSFTTPRPFETSLKIVGKEQVLFGSDTFAHDIAWELGRYLSMPLPDSDLMPGLKDNMAKIIDKTLKP